MQRAATQVAAMVLLLVLACSACRTDYTDEAVERAREFALERTKDLTEPQRNYIRYATPEIQENVIFEYFPMMPEEYGHITRAPEFSPMKSPRDDFMRANFVWNPPGLGSSVVVIGNGDRAMQFWEPLKLIYKSSVPVKAAYKAAWTAAVMYVMNNMLYLSAEERNRVRFSEAEVVRTRFNLKYATDTEKADSSDWENYLKSLEGDKDKYQYSLVWKGDKPGEYIVVTGFSGPELAGWTPLSGMFLKKERYELYVIPGGNGQKSGTESKK